MTLLFDIGNTSVKMAIAKNDEIVKKFVFSTNSFHKGDEFYLLIYPLLNSYKFTKAAVCSVVPEKTLEVSEMIKEHYDIDAFILEPGVKTGLKIVADNPLEVGSDIICASALYDDGLIIDLGTAIKYLYVKDKTLLGVVIGPGLETSLKALVDNTALLPKVEIKAPKTVLGRNTVSCMQSGIVYGLVSQIEGMIQRIFLEVKTEVPVYITGGLSKIIYPHIKYEIKYIPDLVLEGLIKILNRNK